MPTNRFYAKQSLGNLGVFLPKFARFLINDLATFTGPGWTCSFTYSSTAASPFEVPPNPSDMDSLAADNGWRTGGIVNGDYVILKSASAANKFQVGIGYQGASTMRIVVAPYQGFDTTAHKTTLDDAANWLNPRLSARDYSSTGGLSDYSVVADEDRVIYMVEDSVNYYWAYFGKIDNTSTGDTNSCVAYTTSNKVYAVNFDGLFTSSWKRISPVDNSTEITMLGMGSDYISGIGDLTSSGVNYLKDYVTSEYRCLPVYLISTTAGHTAGMGSLRGVYFNNTNLSGVGKGTLGSKAYAFMCNAASVSPVVFDWDGTTVI